MSSLTSAVSASGRRLQSSGATVKVVAAHDHFRPPRAGRAPKLRRTLINCSNVTIDTHSV